MRTIVIGQSGQLAQSLANTSGDVVCIGRKDIDITKLSSIEKVIGQYEVKGIINASAYTEVDKAEVEAESAFLINETSVANLAKYSSQIKVPFVHISTDYVFSGDKGSPYKVGDERAPLGIYGASKAAGEKAILECYPQGSCIIRTSWVYSSKGKNFVKTMLHLMTEKQVLKVIDDQIGSPTSADALARICTEALNNKVTGIHHFTDAGVCSWYDFAVAIQELGLKHGLLSDVVQIEPIPTSSYPTAAKRPSYSVLDKSTLSRAFKGFMPRHWREELELVISQLSKK